ncbi:MAG: PilW family protein [Methylobacillus sp.]|jgi:type IV pilus assembly protein PilW|nr:PilW family protein [Methylobacillus sp.]
MKKTSTKINRQFGVTLIELMVSVAIGLFLIAAIGSVYIVAKNIFASTAAASGMDENVRAAFNMIGTSIRQASFNGCSSVTGVVKGDTRGTNYAGNNWYQNFATPVQSNNAPGLNNLPTGVTGDKLTLIGVDPTREASVASPDNDGIIHTGAHGFNTGEALLAMTMGCDLNSYFVMTDDSDKTVIPHDSAGANDPYNCSSNLGNSCAGGAGSSGSYGNLPAGTLILPMAASAYFVACSEASDDCSAADSGKKKGKSLWRRTYGGAVWSGDGQTEELINGVENMTLEFGVDSNGDGSIDGYAAPGSVGNWNQVIAVRVHLLIATLPDAGTRTVGSNKYKFFNSSTGVYDEIQPADNRIYREYTSVFALRNRTS